MAQAADMIGLRFHADWSATDPDVLKYDEVDAPDKEAWQRANHVQETLHHYIASGIVTAYASTDDGVGLTDLPLHWVTDSAFALCLRTGRFRQTLDLWEPLWIDQPELITALPSIGSPRKKHKFEWDKIVHEAWMFALRSDAIPTKAEVERHLGSWCPLNKQAVPDGSHLSDVARIVIDYLNENKTRRQKLKSESCEAVGESEA